MRQTSWNACSEKQQPQVLGRDRRHGVGGQGEQGPVKMARVPWDPCLGCPWISRGCCFVSLEERELKRQDQWGNSRHRLPLKFISYQMLYHA